MPPLAAAIPYIPYVLMGAAVSDYSHRTRKMKEQAAKPGPKDPEPTYGDVSSPIGGAPYLRNRKIESTETILTAKKKPRKVDTRAYGSIG